MQVEITYEHYKSIGYGLKAFMYELECRITIEPDEYGVDYVISGVDAWMQIPGKNFAYIPLRESDPDRKLITDYARTFYRDKMDERFAEYLADRPKARRPLTDLEEHGTLRAGAL